VETPVAFLIFNRPETTARVFAAIAAAKPPQLLVVADGPRADRPGEAENCAQARAIIDRVDWPCDVMTNYADVNLGCKRRVSSGLDWVFGAVEEAIILEDDCLPDLTFFRFCDELLEKYRDDTRIGQISGTNFTFGKRRWPYSYNSSRTPYIWGWASWRRAWKYYDVDMRLWATMRDEGRLSDVFGTGSGARELQRQYRHLFEGRTANTWDYQWSFACYIQSMLCVVPNVNLVSNIGFGADATHTLFAGRVASLPTEAMQFPLVHPPYILRDCQFERITKEVSSPPIAVRIAARILPQCVKSSALAAYRAVARRQGRRWRGSPSAAAK
jgi:hypothetical protein